MKNAQTHLKQCQENAKPTSSDITLTLKLCGPIRILKKKIILKAISGCYVAVITITHSDTSVAQYSGRAIVHFLFLKNLHLGRAFSKNTRVRVD